MSTLDQTIQALFAKLAERKKTVAALRTETSKSWKTTGSFTLLGSSTPINLQTASEDNVCTIACHLSMMEDGRSAAGVKLGRKLETKIQNYEPADWYSDINKRLATISIREEEAQLGILEQRLNGVLSPEERRRIEVEMLAKELG